MLTLIFPRAGHKINLLRSVAILILVNTLIAVFLTYVVSINAPFQTIWVFSIIIGTCISILIDGLRWLIWRTNKPNRLAFLLVCAAAAPVGYYIGVTISMLIYGIPIPNLGGFITRSDRAMVIMSVFFSLISGVFFWNQSKLAEFKAEAEKEKARHAAIERQAIQAKLQLLQAQIEPHMLFNTLANLQGLIAIDTERAQYMLEQLILYLRASLSSSRTDKTTLKQEFALMHAYLELLAIRMGKRLTYQIDLPKELQSLQIAPMLLQPLVENAIKHGVEPKMEGGHIHVSATMDNHVLHLKVIDTGMGLPSNYKDPIAIQAQVNELQNDSVDGNIQHVGNENIRDRLFALYGASASLTLSPNQPEGAIAHLTIPLQG
ncbi:histidine kinase [Undibacterium sp. RTI2.2]|nr:MULTISPECIES: histidine kinase [unclassified Undibacterium]MEB0116322.1 histidine kinase [Undibacterium sp. RTI2.2]MEB0231440.1 histidine kinase [Undibacterium sp. 10I3]MEB0258099.1 histidine kinase [Undibacterium sp. 5I1]